MDSFMNLAKQGYETYKTSQSDVSVTGGKQYNSPHHSGQSHSSSPDIDHDEVVKRASRDGDGDDSLFSSALSFLNHHKDQRDEPVDEEEVVQAHEKAYKQGGSGGMSSRGIGSAAAMQAFKMFTSGKSEKGSGGSQNDLISMAMAEASKLFDRSGGASSGNKQDAVNGAAMTVMKLMVQSKMSGMVGGKDSGGLSGLMGMASKML